MTYADKIKEFCKQKNIPVSRLEKDLGYGNGYIYQLKDDSLPVKRAVDIAEYLGVPYECLFSQSKKDSSQQLSPLVEKIMATASSCTDEELEKIIEYAEFVLSKR